MIASLKDLLVFEEGRELTPYKDELGIWTIGVGFNLEANVLPQNIAQSLVAMIPSDWRSRYDNLMMQSRGIPWPHNLTLIQDAGGSITDVQCDELYSDTLDGILEWLPGLVESYDSLNVVRQAAFVDMAWNLGENRFSEFGDFISLCNEAAETGNWDQAINDLMHTLVWQQFEDMHNERYHRIADMLTTGRWPEV